MTAPYHRRTKAVGAAREIRHFVAFHAAEPAPHRWTVFLQPSARRARPQMMLRAHKAHGRKATISIENLEIAKARGLLLPIGPVAPTVLSVTPRGRALTEINRRKP